MKELIFKESFNWDERFTEKEQKRNHDEEFYKGILIGIGVCVIAGLVMSLVDLL